MANVGALSTVDPRYTSFYALCFLLQKMKVIELGQKKHSFSAAASMLGSVNAKPHWIPLAVVSLSIEYMEIIPLPRKRNGN